MSSTIINNVLVAVVVSRGTPWYVLFHESYVSNRDQQVPVWEAAFVGTAPDCMDWIINFSCSAEGGMTQWHGKGSVTPTFIIRKWRQAFAQPHTLKNTRARLVFGEPVLDPRMIARREKVLAFLAEQGLYFEEEPCEISINLRQHAGAVAALCASRLVSANELIERFSWGDRQDDWAYAPVIRLAPPDALPILTYYVTGGHLNYVVTTHWIVHPSGRVASTGTPYNDLVRQYAVAAERQYPGSAEATIKRIRIALRDALPVPGAQVVILHADREMMHWDEALCQTMARKLGVPMGRITLTIDEAKQVGCLFELASIMDRGLIEMPGLAASPDSVERIAAAG